MIIKPYKKITRKGLIVSCILIFNVGFIMAQDHQKQQFKTVDLSVELELSGKSSTDYYLIITLTNNSVEPLTIYQHSLPWIGWYSMLLFAFKIDAVGTMINKTSPIDDPGPSRTTIQPNESLLGKLSLVSRFPDLPKALQDRDVIIFWSYQFQPIDAAPLQREGGYMLIPKLKSESNSLNE